MNIQTEHTQGRQPDSGRRPQPEKRKLEKLSIVDWMRETITEMKRLTGWFKQDPQVAEVQRRTAPYPELEAEVTDKLQRLHRKADEALNEANKELDQVLGRPLEVMPAVKAKHIGVRYLQMKEVDPSNRWAWNDHKSDIIHEFSSAFSKRQLAERETDFEVETLQPTATTTLGELRDRPLKRIRVRSESVGGVRVDAVADASQPDHWLEYRIYENDKTGHYITIPGTQDPVEEIMRFAEYSANRLAYAKRRIEKNGEKYKVIFSREPGGTTAPDWRLTTEDVVRAEHWRLALPQDYLSVPLTKGYGVDKRSGPKVVTSQLSPEDSREPVIGPQIHPYDLPNEPQIESRDTWADEMVAAYGVEVGSRLPEHLFTNQDIFDQNYKLWESAAQNEALPVDQAMHMRQVFSALQTEGRKRNLMGQGSYAYVVESYKKIEFDLPKLKESILTVKELLQDATVTDQQRVNFQKELNYLHHLKAKAEDQLNVSLHGSVENFLYTYQTQFTKDEIRDIWAADQALDTAQPADREAAKLKLQEAMDHPARLVLSQQLKNFVTEYHRFITLPTKRALEQRQEDLLHAPGLIYFWDEHTYQTEKINEIKGRAWERVAAESLDRITRVIRQNGESLDSESFAILTKLKDQLMAAVPKTAGEQFDVAAKMRMQNILLHYEPLGFERYVTLLLGEITGQDMRPAWEKTEQELQAEEPSNTFVHELASAEKTISTPVGVEWEMEDVSAEIPGLVRTLRGVRSTFEEASDARHRARQILELAGSDEMMQLATGVLQRLDQLKKLKRLNDQVYDRALASLLQADNLEDRKRVVRNLLVELPVAMMHQLGNHPPVAEQGPDEKSTKTMSHQKLKESA